MDARADLFEIGAEAISKYVDILASRGIDWGVVGPREGERLWDRHILNSIASESLFPEGATVVDVGSGAGLPGIPLAILRPDLRVTLLEPLLRRANFLDLSVAEIGLEDRVRVIRARAEDHHERYAVVVSRALAPLPRLIGWCAPLMTRSGSLLALKGVSAGAELTEATAAIRKAGLAGAVLELPVPGTDEVTWAIELKRA